jgi:hypothetical protein
MKKTLCNCLLSILAVISLFGCGGGGGGGASSNTPSSAINAAISGTAATGAAIAAGTVDFVCANGATGTTVTADDGTYTMNLTAVTLPCAVKVTVPTTQQKIYSIVESGATTANVTPLSHILSTVIFGADPDTVFANFSTYASLVTTDNIAAAHTKVKAALASIGIDVTNYDLLKTSFTATNGSTSGDALDQKLDQVVHTLALAEKSLTQIGTALAAANTNTVTSVTATAVGPAASALDDCAYVRGGKYWTFLYDGGSMSGGDNVTKWNIDISASPMTANVVGSNTNYLVQKLTSGGNVVKCAFTITMPTSVITSYFSKSGVFAWKQVFSNNTVTFGMGVPVQSTLNLNNPAFAGNYPAITYASVLSGGQYLKNGGPSYFNVDSSGNLKFASCSTSSVSPTCGTPSASNTSTNSTCTTNTDGLITCTSADGNSTVKAFAMVNQQRPSLFLIQSGTISGASYTGVTIATKAITLKLPTLGVIQDTSTAWYFYRAPKNNANTAWNFYSGDTISGAATTVTSLNTVDSFYTTSSGISYYLNKPTDGMYWIPNVTNSSFPNGSGKSISLSTGGGWTIRTSSMPTSTVYDGFDIFISKPN